MKLEDFLYFAMSNNSEDGSVYLLNDSRIGTEIVEVGKKESLHLLCPDNSHVPEFDEGFCIYNLSTKSIHNKSNFNISNNCLSADNSLAPPQTRRRVKSTPNLLQIPSSQRSRKKSNDSALGSGEESEASDKMSDVSTGEPGFN